MPQNCRLEYGFLITVLTIVANVLKVIGFISTHYILKRGARRAGRTQENYRKAQPLITTGDAIASFLQFEDRETTGMSIVEK